MSENETKPNKDLSELNAFDGEQVQQFKMSPAQRRRNRIYQQEYRDRQKKKQAEQFQNLTQDEVWARNRKTLSAEQLEELELRQVEFAILSIAMKETAAGLKLGKQVGPPETLYAEVKAFRMATDAEPSIDKPTLIKGLTVPVWSRREVHHHICRDEFVQLQHPDNKQILASFASTDPEWFQFGFYTRLLTREWDEFLEAICKYFESRPGDEDIDWTIAQQAIAERDEILKYKHRHYRTPTPHVNLTESAIAANIAARIRGEERQITEEQERQRLEVWRQMLGTSQP